MLKQITIYNYKTFTKKTTVDFSTTNYKFLEEENTHKKNLKGAIFVGENASGKTNILKAIRFIVDIFFGVDVIDFSDMKSFYTEDDYFEIEYIFNINDDDIKYIVKADNKRFLAESLFINSVQYMYREANTAKLYELDKTIDIPGVSENLSFLRKLYFDTKFNDNITLNKWFDYLKQSVYINCFTGDAASGVDNIRRLLPMGYIEKNGIKQINDFFQRINYRQEINYTNETHNKKGLYNVRATDKFITFKKADTNVEIPATFESTGNKALLSLLPSFMHAINQSCMLIIDEFSSGLHNELEECLLKYFFRFSQNSQIFLVTHSTNILNNSIIRPDQVYSVKFNGLNGTCLKRFSDEAPREAQNLEKMYLNGVFDGKPYYCKTF